MSRYDAREIEPKWQQAWDDAGLFRAVRDPSRPKYYVLEMFPYPSGRIHIGHTRNYTMGDVIARYKSASGFNVLHPMGFDAFGMPAENAAIEMGVHPGTWTYQNIATMRAQMQPMGFSIDWSRQFATCDPEYYGQQQALFLDMLDAGLVTRKAAVVNWDPVDMTVLANEQVIDGRGWRSGAAVERRELVQWFFRITDMAEELLDAIDGLDAWPDKVRTMQRNWIGKSRGLQFGFETRGAPGRLRDARGLHHPPRHPPRRQLRRHRPRPPARPGAGVRSRRRRLRRRVPPCRHQRGGDRDRREEGDRHRHPRGPPVRPRLGAAGLDRQLHPDGLRHRRDLRLPGPRPARPRLRPASTACR